MPVVQYPFQIIGAGIMELPLTTDGNKYITIFQDMFIKWPIVGRTTKFLLMALQEK